MEHRFLGVRNLHWLALVGALYIGWATHAAADTPWRQVLHWWLLIFTLEIPTSALAAVFAHRARSDREIIHWARWKALTSCVAAIGWSLGPVMLYVAGSAGSLMIPTGGIVNFMAACVMAASSYPPAMMACLLCVLLPAAVFFTSQTGSVETMMAICLWGALPFIIAIGAYAARENKVAFAARLRIAELLEIQERQTELILEARREQERFFGAASHDLRQPLHALGLYLSLLPRTRDGQEREQIEARLADCAASLNRQFESILGVAETDFQLANAAPAATPVSLPFSRMAAIFEAQAKRKGLRLRFRPTTQAARIPMDIFERVLANLVSNAIKYTHRGGVLVAARRRAGALRIEIVDTGIGIADEDRSRIFMDFAQVGNLERNRENGSGLGLGIVRRLCDGMNWPLNLRSRLGRGSSFAFLVPLASADAAARLSSERDASHAPEPPAKAANVHRELLIVDDDPLVRDAMERLTRSWEVSVRFADTAEAALATLRACEGPAHWRVLTDYRLPGALNGLELADQLRTEFGDRTSVIIMSAETGITLVEGAKARGLGLIRKPVTPIRLRAALSAG